MADKKVYNEKTKTGWKRVEGKWQYYQNGRIVDTAMLSNTFTGAQDATKKWFKDTTTKAKDIRQQAIEREESYVPQVMSTHKTPITTALTEEVLPKAWDLTKRGAKNLKNAFSDIPKIGQGSGEFDDKGRELSIFELRRQNLKYREMENNNTDDDLLSEEIDLPDGGSFNMMDNLYATYTAEPTGDFTKMWEGVDLGSLDDPYARVNFKNSMDNTFWLTEGMFGATHSTITKENQNKFAATLKHSDNKQLGSPSDELAIKTELGKNLRATNLGGTDPGQSLWLGENSTWSMGGNVVAPKVGTAEAEAMMNIPETTETPIAEKVVTDPVDPVEVDKGLGVEDTSQLVQQNVTVDPVTPAVPAATPEAGANPLPEGFFSGLIDFLNNRGGGK